MIRNHLWKISANNSNLLYVEFLPTHLHLPKAFFYRTDDNKFTFAYNLHPPLQIERTSDCLNKCQQITIMFLNLYHLIFLAIFHPSSCNGPNLLAGTSSLHYSLGDHGSGCCCKIHYENDSVPMSSRWAQKLQRTVQWVLILSGQYRDLYPFIQKLLHDRKTLLLCVLCLPHTVN